MLKTERPVLGCRPPPRVNHEPKVGVKLEFAITYYNFFWLNLDKKPPIQAKKGILRIFTLRKVLPTFVVRLQQL